MTNPEIVPDNITKEGVNEYLKEIQKKEHPEIRQDVELDPEIIKNKIQALDEKHKKNVIENEKNN